MKFILMHRTDARWEAGQVPSPQLVARVGQLMQELAKDKVLLGADGLRASSLGVRLRSTGTHRELIPGPFTPDHELPAGLVNVRARTLDDAVALAGRFADAVGDVEIDIRPITEPWDIGLAPKPPDVTTTRYMLLHKANAASEAGTRRPARQRAALQKFLGELKASNVLLGVVDLRPSSQGRRATVHNQQRTVVDGPFTESKELIAGYILVDLPSMEEAWKLALTYLDVVEAPSVDLRAVAGDDET